jgi:uncharacterized RDD family membrane protein YckC
MNSVRQPPPQPQSAEGLSPDQEDVLGRRISAALIDLAVLLGLFVIIAVAIGESGTEGGSVSLTLDSDATAVYIALVLLYYFMFEVAVGQTVGKLLLGLRVVRADGSPPSVGAIALRTLLRIVDWLPFFYLVGFITMMATGRRRLRLGDLAAKTSISRAKREPARRRLALPPVAFLLVLVLVLTAYRIAGSDGGTKTYRGQGVSFDHPASWGEGSFVSVAQTGDDEVERHWQVLFVVDEENVVIFKAWKLRERVTEERWEEAMLSASERLSPYVFTIIDSTAYAFDCQHKRKDAKAQKIDRECDEAQDTFDTDAPQFR